MMKRPRARVTGGQGVDVIVANGTVRLATTDCGGPGPSIVLMHGLGDSRRSMAKVAFQLDGWRVITMDLRGHGKSTTATWDFPQAISDLEAVIGFYGLENPYIGGHSLGGMVALQYALAGRPLSGAINIDGWGPGIAERYLGEDPALVTQHLERVARGELPSLGARLLAARTRQSREGTMRQVLGVLHRADVVAWHRDVPCLADRLWRLGFTSGDSSRSGAQMSPRVDQDAVVDYEHSRHSRSYSVTVVTKNELVDRVRNMESSELSATAAFLDALTAIEAPLATRPRPPLPGLPDVSPGELREAAARNEARVWKARKTLYETGLTREQAAARAGVTPNQVTNLVRDGELLAIDGPEGLRLAAWQFDPEARRGRLEGIAKVAAAFPGRIIGLSSWIHAPNAALSGRTPREALVDGDVDRVVAVASEIGA